MSATNNMEQQILEFLDGNLSPHEEEELLHRLAVSPERRALLRQHLQVREMVSTLAKKQRLPVPAALTTGVFQAVTSLGYSGPQPVRRTVDEETPVAASLGTSSSSGFFAARATRITVLSIVCLLAGSALTYYLMGGSGDAAKAIQQNALTSPVAPQQDQDPARMTPATVPTAPSSASVSEVSSANSSPIVSQFGHSHLVSRRGTSGRNSHHGRSQDVVGNPAGDVSSTNDQDANRSGITAVTTSDKQKTPPLATDIKSPPQTNATPAIESQNSTKDIREPNARTTRKPNPLDERTLTGGDPTSLKPFSFSVRTGGGKWPGSEHGFTGSLAEIRGSYHLLDWLNVTGTLGLFTPSETGTDSVGMEADGSIDLGMKPHLQYHTLIGAEIGAHFSVFAMPLDLSVGGATDFNGILMPRASIFTSVDLQENLYLRVGVEGMGYRNNQLGSSVAAAQAKYANMHPLLVGTSKSSEIDGFIGPAIELSWRF